MTYREALLLAINAWSADPIEDEWLFENFKEVHVNTMSAAEAFESMADTLDLLLVERDESTAIEILKTIMALANRSNTTEVPPALRAQQPVMREKFIIFGDYANSKLRELFSYYRL